MEYSKSRLIIFLISVYFTCINGQDVCVKKGPCSCVFANGTGIDLAPTSKSTTFFTATNFATKMEGKQYELSTYYYHPCVDMLPPVNKTTANDTCDKALAICRHVSTFQLVNVTANDFHMDNAGISSYLGSVNDSTFSANGNSIIYKNPPSETIVLLVCAETDDQLHIDSLAEPDKLLLKFYSRAACLKTITNPDEGRSFGSTLLIIFFSLTIFYLVLGVCTKKFLMGATGIEVIPNLGFWSDLPNLVKDGWAFSIHGFKLPARGPGPVTSPDPNSYDSI